MNDLRPRPRPCVSCPYRRDVASGVWAAEEYERLPAWDAPTGEQPQGLFCCHQGDGYLCSGWLAHRNPADLLGVRLGIVMGSLDPSVTEYTTSVPLFASGAEAAEHGVAEITAPSERARQAIEKIRRVRDRRGVPVDAQHAAEERACEAALQGGSCGVLVYPEGARPDPRVPYGSIWRAPHGLPDAGPEWPARTGEEGAD